MELRVASSEDGAAIAGVVARAFAAAAHASGTEPAIVAALAADGALTLSLVVVVDEAVVGHAAWSPVSIDGRACGWLGLGPVSVLPERQGRGIGRALIEEGLRRLAAEGAQGCVVLGDPAYYQRFGFRSGLGLTYPGAPAAYFQSLAFHGDHPSGEVAYHPAFATA